MIRVLRELPGHRGRARSNDVTPTVHGCRSRSHSIHIQINNLPPQLSGLQRTCDHGGPRPTRVAAAAHKLPQTGRKKKIQEADLWPDLLSCDAEQPKLGCACALRLPFEWSISVLTLREDLCSVSISSQPRMFTTRHSPSLTF